MTTGMTEATFLEAVGLYATSGTATSTQAAELAADGSNKWALVYELNGNADDSKVIAAGFGENKHVAAAPGLSTTRFSVKTLLILVLLLEALLMFSLQIKTVSVPLKPMLLS